MMRLCIWVAIGLAAIGTAARAADWEMSVTDGASVEIRHKGDPVVQAGYLFWGPEWKWVGVDFRTGARGAAGTSFTGQVVDLGLSFTGTVASPQPNALKYTYRLKAARQLANIIGGGFEFQLKRASGSLGGQASDPVLLDDRTGWRWPVGGGEAISVVFSKPLPDLHFEVGDKGRIRAMFVGKDVSPGESSFTMTVTLPKGGQVARSLQERYGPADTASWVPDAMRYDVAPVDVSFLNDKPAGKHGFVKADGDRFVFSDGTPVRFWGGNLAAYALFSDKAAIKQQAHRIAALGFNLMRLHHHDSTAWVSPTVIDKSEPDSQHLDAKGMDGIDWWIKCLRDEGVYVWLDMHVGRQLKPGDGVTQGFEEIKKQNGEVKGFCYFNDGVRGLMQKFNRSYLGHVNPYTGVAIKDDPAVMGVLLTNEDDLTHHFGNLMLGDKGNPVHNAIFATDVKEFATRWGLNADQAGRTWEPGPSKLFLNEYEHRFNQAMIADLRGLGVKAPIATTNYWGGEALYSLPALTDGNMIDVHSYGDPEALSVNPRYAAGYIPWIGAAQVYGKPVAITEWNVPYPAVDRFTSPLYVAAIGALQGWDAPMIYNYSQSPFGDKPGRPDTWSSYYDPGLEALMPAAAIAFRRGDISPAKTTYVLDLSPQQLYSRALDPNNSAAIRTLVEQSRLTIGLPQTRELPWVQPAKPAADVKVVTDPAQDFIPAGRDYVVSDTGQIRRDWSKGIQTIDTPASQAASGWIGGERIALTDAVVSVQTPKAAVALTSLDGKPIVQSSEILVTAVARVVASPGDRTPYLSEPVRGTVSLRSSVNGLRLVGLNPDGTKKPPVALTAAGGRYTITIPAGHWFLLAK